jgi:hypothetical protein
MLAPDDLLLALTSAQVLTESRKAERHGAHRRSRGV